MKYIVAIAMSLMLVISSQAQSSDWRDYPDGGEINCQVIQQIISTHGNKFLFRKVPNTGFVSVRRTLDEVFSMCAGDERAVSKSTTARPTSTPQPSLTASTIRSLVNRHTKDIRILKLDVGATSITLEYDLKPWHFVPNQSIAEEVTFKVICAIRKGGKKFPSTIKFIGQGRFKTDLGRKFKSPSVEMHIRASTANEIVCQGNSYSDINWRRVASTYKSYPVPSGASVDYD